MKRALHVALATLVSLIMVTIAFAGTPGKLDLKVGDEVYVCNCGAGCPCNTMALKEGKCTCGNQMVKVKVLKVEKDTAVVQAPGWDQARTFQTVGKYMCACGPSCNCGTISQHPGKCVCGSELKPVK